MSIRIFTVLSIFLLPFALYADDLQTVPPVTMPICIDGQLTETAWRQALRIEAENYVYWLALDQDRFAVAVQSRRLDGIKPVARAVPRTGNSPAFIDDCVELNVNGRLAAFNARGAVWQKERGKPIRWNTASQTSDDGTWTFEASASCAELGISVSAASPDGSAARPDSSAAHPDSSAARPDGSAARPDSSAARPDSSAASAAPSDSSAATVPVSVSVPVSVIRRWFNQTRQADCYKIGFDFAYYPSANIIKLKADVSAVSNRDQVSGAVVRLVDVQTKTILDETPIGPFKQYRAQLDRWPVPDLKDGEYELNLILQKSANGSETSVGSEAAVGSVVRSFVRHKFEWEGNQIGMSDRLIPPFTAIKVSERGQDSNGQDSNGQDSAGHDSNGQLPDQLSESAKQVTIETLLRRHTLDSIGLWSQVEITDSKGDHKRLLSAPTRLEIAIDGSPTIPITGSGVRWTRKTATRVEGEASWSVRPESIDSGSAQSVQSVEIAQSGSAQSADSDKSAAPLTIVSADTNSALDKPSSANKTAVAPVSGLIRVVWDFDGLVQWNLTLNPTNRKVDFLKLTIPMANKLAPLMHVCTDGIRFNYAGSVPAGTGCVWRSSDAPRRQIVGSFAPYLWVGAEEPGLAIFAENDCGWVNDSQKPCQELIREGQTLNIVYNLINRPTRISTARTINLGFQATPIKPMPPNWRRKTFGAWQTSSYVPPEDYLNFWGACYYWGAETPCRDYYPRGRDMSYLKKIAQFRNGGEKDVEFMRNWMDGYKQALNAITDPDQRIQMDKTYRAHVNAGFNVRQFAPICAYTNGRGVRFDTPEGQTFVNEWIVSPYASRNWPYGGGVDYDLDPVASFRDYAVWYFKQMAEIAVDTIYWDDFFFVSNFNTLQTAAYRISDPETGESDGQIQPSMGLYNMREYVRRTAVMYLEMGRTPNNIIHDTNAAINPILSMAQMNYTWEDKPGDADFQERFSRDYIRAESIGRQQGNIPFNLWLVSGQDEQKREWAGHTGTGVALTHEMRSGGADYWSVYRLLYDFGYGTDSVAVSNYWDDDYPVSVSGLESSSLLLSKGTERILLICDWSDGEANSVRTGSAKIDGFLPTEAVNLQTGQKLKIVGEEVLFSLKRHDYILIKLAK